MLYPCSVLLPPACAGRSCFSLINFLIPLWGLLAGLMGLLACIGSGLLVCCCAPKHQDAGACKFTAVRTKRTGTKPPHRPKQTHRTPAAPLPTPYLTPITLIPLP